MDRVESGDPVLRRLIAWGHSNGDVRAIVLTSTRAAPDGAVDAFSDYDVVLVLDDPGLFAHDDAWTSVCGEPMVRWGDDKQVLGEQTYFRGVHYGGARVDYTLWPVALARRITAPLPSMLDVGYRILLDKDRCTATWPKPTFQAYLPTRPSGAEYCALVEQYWWEATVVAKSLRRGDVVHAKYVLDTEMKLDVLGRFLEWRIQLDRDKAWKPGVRGRGIEPELPAGIWERLAATYVGVGIDANWDALFAANRLLREVATDVGAALGYTYPQGVDDRVTRYLEQVRIG
jgi:aminoglycoside 6-adenylyltransferase